MKIFFCLLLIIMSTKLAAESTVFITGSNRGIGLGLVKEFADHGWRVIATCRSPEKAEELKALAAGNNNIVIEQLDVIDYARIDALAEQYRAIDVLINNAGLLPIEEWDKPFSAMDFDYARKVFEVNTFAPVKIMQAFMHHVAASKHKKIVNISSQAGSFANDRHQPYRYVYRGSKAALNMFSFDIAPELGEMGIITVAVHPGTVATQGGEIEELKDRFPNIITVKESASKIYAKIEGLTPADNGKFLSYEPGQEMSW